MWHKKVKELLDYRNTCNYTNDHHLKTTNTQGKEKKPQIGRLFVTTVAKVTLQGDGS